VKALDDEVYLTGMLISSIEQMLCQEFFVVLLVIPPFPKKGRVGISWMLKQVQHDLGTFYI